jgi:hypothetical protein
MYAYTVPDPYSLADIHILTQRAVTAYHGPALNMTEMPDPGACTYNCTIINITALMDKNVLHQKQKAGI